MNKVIITGNLTKDPDLNFTAGSGTAVAKFSVAVKRPFKKDEVDFINCVSFGKTAETIAQYFTKGKPIAIVGRIQTGSYDAKDGTKRYTTDVIVESFEFIGGQGKQNDGNVNQNGFDNTGFEDEMTPVDDEPMPF